MYDNIILKNYLKDRKYTECIALLKKKIVSYVIKEIRKKDDTIYYTTVSDLISTSDFYLNDSSIAYRLSYALLKENQLDQIQDLLTICEQNGIK